MFCPYCGNEIKGGSLFCEKCGKKLENGAVSSSEAGKAAELSEKAGEAKAKNPAPVSGAPKKKPGRKAMIGIIAGGAVLAAAVILIVLLLAGPGSKNGKTNFAVPSGAIEYFEKDDQLYIVNAKGALTRVALNGGEVNEYTFKTDSNNEKAVFLIEHEAEDWFGESTYDLYYYDGNSAVKITETAHYYYNAFQISSDGNTVVYQDEEDIYTYSGGNSTLSASGARLTAVSPDGKTIGYYRQTEDKEKGYYRTGGKEHFLLNSGYPVLMTNNADVIYILRSGSAETVYVQKKDKEDTRVKLWSGSEAQGGTINYDGTQLLFAKKDGTYLCENGKEPVKISDKQLNPLLPSDLYYSNVTGGRNIKDLKKAIYVAGYSSGTEDTADGIFSISSGKAEAVVSGIDYSSVYDATVSPDGRSFAYEDGEGLHYIRIAKGSEARLIVDADDYELYFIDSGLTAVFYWNEFDELYFKKGDGKAVKVFDADTNKVVGTSCLLDKKLYFVQDNTLYCADGGKAYKVRDDVVNLYGGKKVLLVSDPEGNVYSSTDGKRFTKIADNDFIY